jgi:nicotinamidase/pyrazinamidase
MTAGYDNTTGLIVVDVQNDFADPNGNLYVTGGEQILGPVNEEVAAAAAAGSTVVYTQDWHPPVTPHFEKDGGIWPTHCVAETWGAELHPNLSVVPGAEIVRKGVAGEDGYSAFSVREPDTGERHGTGLDDLLWERGIQRVVVVGLATDYCVKETVLDALRCGLAVSVLAEGIRAVDLNPGDGEQALEEMQAAGAEIG